MKNLILTLVLALGFGVASAQLIKEKEPIDPKYLAGAVPVVDGKVTFSREIEVKKDLSADSLYHLVARWTGKYFNSTSNSLFLKRSNMGSSLAEHRLQVGVVQYLVFRSTALVLDRSQIIYCLTMTLADNKIQVQMSDITYYYEEERRPEKFTAEEWITDENALNRKKDGYVWHHGKFREKTIDLFDDIVNNLEFFIFKL